MDNIFLALYDFSGGMALLIGLSLFVVIIINAIVVLIEAIVLKKMNFGSLMACFLVSSLMNLLSALAGYSTSYIALALCDLDCRGSVLNLLALLPGFAVDPQLEVSSFYLFLFFALCYVLTVVLELGVLLLLRREHSLGKIGKMVLVTNFFSYLFLIIVFELAKGYLLSPVR